MYKKMSMSVELDESFDPPGGNHLASYCKPAYRVRWLKNKGAILILFWNYLVLTTYYLFRAGYKEKQLDKPFHVTDTGIILWCTGILFPIGGWLADTRIGRYRVIHYSMLLMWVGTILATFGELLLTNVVSSEHHAQILDGVYSCLCVFVAIGLGGFISNVIHLGIDQLADASATEITSFISWYMLTLYVSGMTVYYITDCIVTLNTFYIKSLLVAVCLTLAVCMDFLFRRVLVREQITGDSLVTIIKVTTYVIRNARLRRNCYSGMKSRFDVAKHMYGGQFTSQQVDNVRKFLVMLAIIATSTIVFGSMEPINYAHKKIQRHFGTWNLDKESSTECYKNLTFRYSAFLFVIVMVAIYEFVIHPLFYRCLPKVRLADKVLFAMATYFVWILSLLCVQVVTYHQGLMTYGNHSMSCLMEAAESEIHVAIGHGWLLILSFLEGLSHYLLAVSALEFIWAQAPTSMKGLTLGLGYMFVGLYTVIHAGILAPFVFDSVVHGDFWERAPLSCDIWYYTVEGVITLIVLVVMFVVVRMYGKLRERNVQN